MWFRIKQKKSKAYGSKHNFSVIEKTRKLSPRTQQIMFPIIKRNGYFAHHENIMIGLINDDKKDMRKLGWRRILKARQGSKNKNIRVYEIPDINFQAGSYHDMVDWNINITEPPLTTYISDEDIFQYIETGDLPRISAISLGSTTMNNIPCHSQAVERNVKLVTEASQNVVGQISRDGYIKCTIKSRNNMPCFETKSNLNLNDS